MYSWILARTIGGRCGDAKIRFRVAAERPEFLYLPLRMVQVVLRESPMAFACASSAQNPAAIRASPISLILDDCRDFISAAVCAPRG